MFKKDHRFSFTALENRTAASLDDVPDSATPEGRYIIDKSTTQLKLAVDFCGEPVETGNGTLDVFGWLHRPTEIVNKSLIALENAIHLGQACVVTSGGGLFPESTAHGGKPARGETLVRRNREIFAEADIPIARTIEGPVLYLDYAAEQFGHFLLDFISRLWAVEWARSRGYQLAVYTHKRRAFLSFQADFLAPLGLTDNDFLFLKEPVRFRRVFMPAPLFRLHRGVNPEFGLLCETIGDAILQTNFGGAATTTNAGPRIYLSRRLWGKRRVLVNEQKVEELFVGHGYTVIHPETLKLAEQIRIARQATHIAAPIGSQTYLALFQTRPKSSIILAPSTFTFADDAIISAMRQVPTTFVLGKPIDVNASRPRDHNFSVDLDVLDEAIRAHGA